VLYTLPELATARVLLRAADLHSQLG
jgi:hypothetical protein